LRRRSILSRVPVAALVAIALSGCDWFPGRPNIKNLPQRPSDVSNFNTLYSANCAGCHGNSRQAGAVLALDNKLYLAIIDDSTMRETIEQGVAGTAMPPFAESAGGDLTARQIDIIVSGIRKNWAGPADVAAGAPPYSTSAPGNPENGAQVYAANCQACHGAAAVDAARPHAGSIVNASYLSLVSNQYLRTVTIAGRPELGHPDWKHDASGQALTAGQVSDVVAWLASKRQSAVANGE
jgi:cytochrome c oxidase cbb3-type subunit III